MTSAPIADLATSESGTAVTGLTPDMVTTLKVDVKITHSYLGDLVLHLVAPDGTTYLLEDVPDGDTGDDVRATYWVDASAEAADGVWALQVRDAVAGNSGGVLDAWSIQFGVE